MFSIAIVGRPNVGKSTLFNKLTNANALVVDEPGVTRDRQYAIADLEEHRVVLIDSGGLNLTRSQSIFDRLVLEQSFLAVKEADLVFFLVDAQNGLSAEDHELGNKLRKFGKKLWLIINKVDRLNPDDLRSEFSSLGFDPSFTIAAKTGTGLGSLKKALLSKLATLPLADNLYESAENAKLARITIIGRPNVGKSTLINTIVGEQRVITSENPGTTRDSIEVKVKWKNQEYLFVDTAGVRRRTRINEKVEQFSVVKTLQNLSLSQGVLLVIDGTEGITDQDLRLLKLAVEEGKVLVIAINKRDLLSTIACNRLKSELGERLAFISFVDIHFISAFRRGDLNKLFVALNRGLASVKRVEKKVSTSKVNQILSSILDRYPPPLTNGREVKLRYAHLGDVFPVTIVIHGVRTKFMSDNYKRYLSSTFRQALRLSGTTVKIKLVDTREPSTSVPK